MCTESTKPTEPFPLTWLFHFKYQRQRTKEEGFVVRWSLRKDRIIVLTLLPRLAHGSSYMYSNNAYQSNISRKVLAIPNSPESPRTITL